MTEERIHRSWLLGVLLTGPFMAQADVTIVNVATPSVHADLGAVSGQILGDLLVSANVAGLGWRAVFLVNVPIGVLAVVAALRFLPADAMSARSRLDLAGVALLSVSVLLLVLPLTLGRSAGWPAWAWACLAVSPPAGMAFLAVQDWVARRGGAPLVNLHLFAIPVIRWGMVTMMTATSTYYALMFTLLQFAALTGRMTGAVQPRYAPDISGVSSTLIQIGGSIGVAAIGALYLDLAPGGAHATHAFGVTTAALAGLAVLASTAAFRATRPAPIAVPAAPDKRAALQETRR